MRLPAIIMTATLLSTCADGGADPFPEFPWPPPQASASEVLPPHLLSNIDGYMSVGDVDGRITAALDANGYYESSYLAVPDGFALVTRLEQIESDGTPKEGPDRWSLDVAAPRPFALEEYFRHVLFGTPGHYRVIVFIVTPNPFSQSDAQVTPDQFASWLAHGFNRLPDEVASLGYTADFATTALIYQFDRPTENDVVSLNFNDALPGRIHLERSGIWRELQP